MNCIQKAILIAGAAFCLNLTAYAQDITLKNRNITVKEAMEELKKASGYSFVFSSKDVNTGKKISLSAEKASIEEVVNQILQGQDNLTYEIRDKKIIVRKAVQNTAPAKAGKVKGTIVDATGMPVIGAAVKEKGTSNGVVSDIDGNFALEVGDNATLEISYIGYKTLEIKASQKPMNITMVEDAEMLDEVVVVGYGTAKKSDLTGAVVRADLSALQESPNISLGQALRGTIPGLNIGAVTSAGQDPSMSIRGRTSISGSTSPLIVLDGIIFRGNMVEINMNDVESIDVLKDASATAIYGSQASNGVILITSKSGKNMTKPTIEYSGSYTFQSAANNDMRPEGREGFLRRIADTFLSESRIGDDMLQMNPNWDVTKYLMDGNALDGYNNGTDTDWWDLLTNDHPYIQNHNISVRGKNELSSYFFSVGYTDQQNLIKNDTYKRYSIRLNLDTKITNWLKVGMQSFFTLSDYSGISPDISTCMGLPPLCRPYDENGELIKQPYKTGSNPLQMLDRDNLEKRYNLFANFHVDIDFPFLKGLNYRMNFSPNLIDYRNFNFNEWGSNFTGSANKQNSNTYSYTFDNILTYKNKFGKHDVNATLVFGVEERQYETTNASASHFANFALGYNSLQMGQADLQQASSGAWKEASLYSMLRLSYIYNDKYIFTGTVRRDGFSGFGANHKYGIFPSGAIAWRISEEDFFKEKVDWMENLKLRLSYGQNGNRTVGRYQTLAKMGSGNSYLFGDGGNAEIGQWISALPNADLRWETTSSFNIGVDFSALKGRLYGTLEYYLSRTHNMLYNISVPQINGIGSIATNIGKMDNKGFEMTITGVPVQTKDFSWDLTFNFSRNRNKVKSILGLDNDGDGREDDLIANKIFIGKPYGVCYDYNIIGMWQISDKLAGKIPAGFEYGTYKVEDINQDGNYTAADDRKILGYTDPAYRFSILNSFRYKNWELKFMINSIQGGKDYYYGRPAASLPNPDNIYQNNLFKFDYWTPENPNARYRQIGKYPTMLGYSFSPYIQRNFVRLQNVTLSYNVPISFLKKFNVNRLKLYVTGDNLLTFTDWDGWDPEVGTGLTQGDRPVMKSYSVGVNVEF